MSDPSGTAAAADARIAPARAVAATLLMQVMAGTLLVTLPVLAPRIAESTGVPASRIGEASGLLFLGALLPILLTGPFVRRWGGIRVMQISLAFGGVAMLLSILGGWWAILAAAVLMGAGYGPGAPAASHVLARHTPDRLRGLIFSVKQSGAAVGGVLAGLVYPPIAVAWGWPAAILVGTGLCLAAALVSGAWRAAIDGVDRDLAAAPVRIAELFRALRIDKGLRLHPELPRLSFVGFASSWLQGTLFALYVTFLVESIGRDLVSAGAAFATMQTAGTAARILFGAVSDSWILPQRLLALLSTGSILAVAAIAATTPDWPTPAILAVAACAGATVSGWQGVYLSELARIVPIRDVGAATGVAVALTFVGYVLGPVVASLVTRLTGSFTTALLLSALPPALAVLSYGVAQRRRRLTSRAADSR